MVIACMLANKRDHIRKQITTTRTGIYVTLLLQLTYEFLMATKRKSDVMGFPPDSKIGGSRSRSLHQFSRRRISEGSGLASSSDSKEKTSAKPQASDLRRGKIPK